MCYSKSLLSLVLIAISLGLCLGQNTYGADKTYGASEGLTTIFFIDGDSVENVTVDPGVTINLNDRSNAFDLFKVLGASDATTSGLTIDINGTLHNDHTGTGGNNAIDVSSDLNAINIGGWSRAIRPQLCYSCRRCHPQYHQ